MKDQDLVNALRACSRTNCSACPQNGKYRRLDIRCITDIERQAADVIEAQAKEIEKLRGYVPRWIPVEERLPETQGWYHVAIRDEKTKRIAVELDLYAVETAKNCGHEIGFCKDGRWYGREKVIAWMPLPEPPEVERSKQ